MLEPPAFTPPTAAGAFGRRSSLWPPFAAPPVIGHQTDGLTRGRSGEGDFVGLAEKAPPTA